MKHVIWMGMLLAAIAAVVPGRAAGQDTTSVAARAGQDTALVAARTGPVRPRFDYSVPADSAPPARRRLFSLRGAVKGEGIGCLMGGLGFAASSVSDSAGGALFHGMVGCVVGAVPGFLLGGILLR